MRTRTLCISELRHNGQTAIGCIFAAVQYRTLIPRHYRTSAHSILVCFRHRSSCNKAAIIMPAQHHQLV